MATLKNSIRGRFKELVLSGNSVQLSTTGKNLFDLEKAKKADSYETVSVGDVVYKAIVYNVSPNTDYTLSVSGKTSGTISNLNIANTTTRFSLVTSGIKSRTVNSLDSGLVYVFFSEGALESNIEVFDKQYFDIQLETGKARTSYEPYTGGKPSPSSEYQQEIKSAGRKDNLWTYGDVTITSGSKQFNVYLEEGKTYTFSAIISTDKDNISKVLIEGALGTSSIEIGNTNRTHMTAKANMSKKFIRLYSSNTPSVPNGETTVFKDIKLVEGDDPDGKFAIDVKVTGANLWNDKSARPGYYGKNGEFVTGNNNLYMTWEIEAPYDGKYDVRCEADSPNGIYICYLYNTKRSEIYTRLHKGKKSTISLKKGINYISASGLNTGSDAAIQATGNEKIMLCIEGTLPTTFESYKEPQSLTLTSNRPLTKWDKLVEQGGQYGWLYQSRIEEYYGNTTLSLYKSGFNFLLNNKKDFKRRRVLLTVVTIYFERKYSMHPLQYGAKPTCIYFKYARRIWEFGKRD